MIRVPRKRRKELLKKGQETTYADAIAHVWRVRSHIRHPLSIRLRTGVRYTRIRRRCRKVIVSSLLEGHVWIRTQCVFMSQTDVIFAQVQGKIKNLEDAPRCFAQTAPCLKLRGYHHHNWYCLKALHSVVDYVPNAICESSGNQVAKMRRRLQRIHPKQDCHRKF